MSIRYTVVPLVVLSAPILAGNPMNAEWFYGNHEAAQANKAHQERRWAEAESEYDKLKDDTDPNYMLYMVRLNRAACRMAQRKSSSGWSGFGKAQDPDSGCDPDYIESCKNTNSVLRWVAAKAKNVAGTQKTFTVETGTKLALAMVCIFGKQPLNLNR